MGKSNIPEEKTTTEKPQIRSDANASLTQVQAWCCIHQRFDGERGRGTGGQLTPCG